MIYKETKYGTIHYGNSVDILKQMESNSINCCITSPPYWSLRDYDVEGQLGIQPTIEEYVDRLCNVFDEVKRVLRDDGTLWVNMGDTYASSGGASRHMGHSDPKYKNGRSGNFAEPSNYSQSVLPKSLCQIPSRFAIEMANRGWILRNEIIWHKPNCMPSSAKDRFTVDFEYLFFFVKNKKYWFEQQFEPIKIDSIKRRLRGNNQNKYSSGRERPAGVHANTMSQPRDYQGYDNLDEIVKKTPGRNKRTVWQITTKPYKGAHFATFPTELIETPIKSGCPLGGIVLDPFFGAGTTAIEAISQGKRYVGIDLNEDYCKIAYERIIEKEKENDI